MTDRICLECNTPFAPRDPRQVVCSRRCAARRGSARSAMLMRRPPEERFWEKVERTDGCWEWTAHRSSSGYGRFRLPNGRGLQAHRYSYELLVGPIPEGLQLDHLCRNRGCVNPAHLEPVTQRENLLRGVGASAQHASKTHCIHGHPLDGDNLRITVRSSGHVIRVCRICAKVRMDKYNAKRYAAQKAARWA